MRRFLFILSICLLTTLLAFSQSTPITATHLAKDLTGTLLPAGKFCLLPVNSLGVPSGFQVAGTQYGPSQACFTVTTGAISGVSVPDTSMASPAGIGYRVTLTDAGGTVINSWPQPIYPSGSSAFNFDTWSPQSTALVTNPGVTMGTTVPQGRCGTSPAIFYNASNEYHCFEQVWQLYTASGSISASTIATALGFTPASADDLSTAISNIPTLNASNIENGLGFTPISMTDLNTAIASVPTVTASNIITALGFTPLSQGDLLSVCAISGCSMTGALNLTDGSPAASQQYVQNAIAAAVSGSSGGGSGTGTTFNTNIGTIVRTGSMSDGSIAFKTCYVGSSVCSGGVGDNAPSTTPVRQAGLSSPSANTGTSNAVASYTLTTALAQPNFTDVLWTTTGGGLGADTTSTNWARDLWVKAAFPAGHTHIEFDTYDFAGGWDLMLGQQCNATSNLIQYANQSSTWMNTAVPCGSLFDGAWHHIQATYHRDLPGGTFNCSNGAAPCEWWDTIAIDGTLYVINKSMPQTTTTWSGSGGQIQLDTEPISASSGSPAAATLYVDSDTVTAGLAPDNGTTGPGGNGGSTASGTGEEGSFSFDGSSPTASLTAVGSPAISTSNYHTSPKSMSFPAGQNYFTYNLPTPSKVIYTRQYLYITSLGSTANSIMRFYHGGQELFVWYLSTGGVVTAFNQATGSDIGSAYTYPIGSLHLIETYTKIDPSAGQVIVKVDGTVQYTSASNLNTGSTTVDTVWFGQIGGTAPVGWGTTYMDNADFSALGWIGPI